jgi:hypothetical protein
MSRPFQLTLSMGSMLGALIFFSPSLTAQDLAPERISNVIVELTVLNRPVPLGPEIFSEDGLTYQVSNFGSTPPVSQNRNFTWTKTGPNTGTFILTSGSFRTERLITFSFSSPTFGFSGTFRENDLNGTVRITPFDLVRAVPLRNASTRVALASSGVATMGFVVAGATSRRVLVRAIGPALAQFGVASPAMAPVLTVLQGNAPIGSNSGWGGAAELAAVFTRVGAFALPAASRDCALMLTLAAGNYTARVQADNAGEVLFEVYFVD